MSSERDARLAVLRRNQKENFVGAEVKKARRVSELRIRQKDKRRSVWDQGREGLAEFVKEEEEQDESEVNHAVVPQDRKQMLLQWKKKRDEQMSRVKAHRPKPFKVGSRNLAPAVPLPSVSSLAKAKPPVTKAPSRSVRASTRAQRVNKENMRAAGKGSKGKTAIAAAPSKPTKAAAASNSRPALANFNFQGLSHALDQASSDKFTTLFPKAEFSPFQFKFRKNLVAADLVTVRGQTAASPPSSLATADSPALWPQTPGKDNSSRPSSTTPASNKKNRRRSAAVSRKVQPLHIASCNTSADDLPAVVQDSCSPVASPAGALPETTCQSVLSPKTCSGPAVISSPRCRKPSPWKQPARLNDDEEKTSSPPLASYPAATACTRGEASTACLTEATSTSPVMASDAATVSMPFRKVMDETAADLNQLSDTWEQIAAESHEELPEDVAGQIDTTVGQARLLVRERFRQFSKLCDGADNPGSERQTHASDLEGFWEMVGFQVDDVKQKFATLSAVKDNQWQRVSKTPKKKKTKTKRTVAKKKTPGKAAAAARERMRQFRAAKKMEAEASMTGAAEQETEPAAAGSAAAVKIDSPVQPQSYIADALSQTPEPEICHTKQKTPKSRRMSLRQQAMSAKKQTPLVEAPAGFDFTKYIEPMSGFKPEALSMDAMSGDLMAFSPLSVQPIASVQSISPVGAFVRDLAPLTPSHRRRSKVTSIAALDSHIVMTPVRRSLRLQQTPAKDRAAGLVSALPDLAEYSVWPNTALD